MCAGVRGISSHDFRRGYTIKSMRRGMDLLTLRLLGYILPESPLGLRHADGPRLGNPGPLYPR